MKDLTIDPKQKKALILSDIDHNAQKIRQNNRLNDFVEQMQKIQDRSKRVWYRLPCKLKASEMKALVTGLD